MFSVRLPQGLHLRYPNPNITYFVEEINCGYVVRLVLFGATYDIQVQLHPESFLLLDDGSVLVFRRAVLALHRSDSPVLRADVPSWYDESDSGVECDIGSAFVNV